MALPLLIVEDLQETRDYLRDICLALGAFQRGFLPKHPRLWEHGLEIGMRGITTQALKTDSDEIRASLDLVRGKVRIGEVAWPLKEYGGFEVFNNLKVWLESKKLKVELEKPGFIGGGSFSVDQVKAYAEALWWMDEQFRNIKKLLKGGAVSPILLYPHHFDLAMNWFPYDDDKQLSLGFSAGDNNIYEPYVYLTSYPEPEDFKSLQLPEEAHWHEKGFSGAVLPYAALASSSLPETLLKTFAVETLTSAKEMLE